MQLRGAWSWYNDVEHSSGIIMCYSVVVQEVGAIKSYGEAVPDCNTAT